MATPTPRRSPKWMGHGAVFLAYFIFGLNIVVCKDLTTSAYLSPYAIFLVRSVCSGALFWLLGLFVGRHERVALRDYPRIFMASVLGFFLTQLTFLIAVPLISPVETGVMSSMSPIYTMLVAAVALHEPITWRKVSGVALSFGGVIYLIITGMSGNASVDVGTNLWGMLLMVGNALFFSLYLGIFRPLIERYTVVTFMKWIFLMSAVLALPLGAGEVMATDFTALPAKWLWELAYLVVMATFVAYFLIPFGQKIIRPTLVSMYSYVQPIVAIAISIIIGRDTLTVAKAAAVILVFLGVYIVSRSRAAAAR